jgi:hypothetical protein
MGRERRVRRDELENLTNNGGHDPEMLAERPIHGRNDAVVGALTGTSRRCQLEGCTGRRYGARWSPGGDITWPCSKGIFERPDGELQIA